MTLFCRAALTLLASLLLCTASHAEPEVIQGSLGDVIRVPITADCPAQSVVRQYTLILDGNNTGIPAQGCGATRTPYRSCWTGQAVRYRRRTRRHGIG